MLRKFSSDQRWCVADNNPSNAETEGTLIGRRLKQRVWPTTQAPRWADGSCMEHGDTGSCMPLETYLPQISNFLISPSYVWTPCRIPALLMTWCYTSVWEVCCMRYAAVLAPLWVHVRYIHTFPEWLAGLHNQGAACLQSTVKTKAPVVHVQPIRLGGVDMIGLPGDVARSCWAEGHHRQQIFFHKTLIDLPRLID